MSASVSSDDVMMSSLFWVDARRGEVERRVMAEAADRGKDSTFRCCSLRQRRARSEARRDGHIILLIIII